MAGYQLRELKRAVRSTKKRKKKKTSYKQIRVRLDRYVLWNCNILCIAQQCIKGIVRILAREKEKEVEGRLSFASPKFRL